jgi:DNA topoisomerase IA
VRIAFHEITKSAILEALAHPRELDLRMVNAQQARRVLDRLVGYELSPFLWKKVAKGLSAGRVQSVAIRFIVEREREIQKFISSEYWNIALKVSPENKKNEFEANLFKIKDKAFDKLSITEEKANEIEGKVKDAKWFISKIEKKSTKKSPAAPFTTATLQQSANRHLGFSAKQTMVVAQKLYEQGFITYMRTDSLNLSQKFLNDAREYLEKEYAPLLSQQDIIGIANFTTYVKLNINNATTRPFDMKTIWDNNYKNTEAAKITNERQRLVLTKLLDGFEGNLTSSKYAKITKTSPDTALRDINDLIEKGILLKSNSGGRSTNYLLNF